MLPVSSFGKMAAGGTRTRGWSCKRCTTPFASASWRKAHGKRTREDDERMAAHVVAHLLRANFWIQRSPPQPAHSTSDLGRKPGGMPDGCKMTPPP